MPAPNEGGWEELKEFLLEKMDRAMYRAALRVQSLAKMNLREAYVPDGYRTGQLMNSIEVRKIGPLQYEIGSTLDYAWYVEVGTGIFGGDGAPFPIEATFTKQPIRPKNKKALSFDVVKPIMVGKTAKKMTKHVVVKEVKGQHGKWYMSKAYAELPKILLEEFAKEFPG